MKWFYLLIISVVMMMAFIGCSSKPKDQAANQQTSSGQSTSTASAPAVAPEQTPVPAPAPDLTQAREKATSSQPAQPAKPTANVIPAGTTITVRLGQALSSKTSQEGEGFTATVANPVSLHGKTVIPTSSTAEGTVVNAQSKGKIKGEAVLQLALNQITINGHTYPIETSTISRTEKGKGKRSAATTGGGALIGGIAGGGKGAAIGAAAGLTGGALTGNKQIEIPAESMLSFKLKKPLTLQ